MFNDCSTSWLVVLLYGNEDVIGYRDLAARRRHIVERYPDENRSHWSRYADEADALAAYAEKEIDYRLNGELVPSGD